MNPPHSELTDADGMQMIIFFFLRNVLSKREIISNLSEQCLVGAVNLELSYFLFILFQFLHLGVVIFCGMNQGNLLSLNLILTYFEK